MGNTNNVETRKRRNAVSSLPSHFASIYDEFIVYISVERGLAHTTVQAYGHDVRRYFQWLHEQHIDDLRDVTTDVVEYFLMSLRDLSPRSRARQLATLRDFYTFYSSQYSNVHNPVQAIRSPHLSQDLPDVLSIEEISALMEAAGSMPQEVGLRNRALLEFLYATGCRVSEAVQVNLGDYDIDERWCKVTGKGSKQRLVPLGSFALNALENYVDQARPTFLERAMQSQISSRAKHQIVRNSDFQALFLNMRGRRLSRQSVWEILQQVGRLAGIHKQLHPHILRHSFATHLIQGGADVRTVQELLGHASVVTTQIYTHIAPETLIETYIMSHPRAR